MKILLVTNKCPPDYDGGYELRAFQIAKALRGRGHEVDIATSHFRAGFMLSEPEPSWVHRIFRFVPISSLSGIARKADAALRRIACTRVASYNVPAMRRFLEGRQYDIAYCFGLHRISLATAYPLKEQGTPVLWHAGGTYIADQLHRWPREVVGFELGLRMFAGKWYEMERKVDYSNIAFVSEFLRDYFAQYGLRPKRSFIISRGADFPVQRDVDRARHDPPLFFMASRLDREKGVHTAFKAAQMLAVRRPDLNWRLQVAGNPGDSSYRKELLDFASSHGIADRIELLGKLPREEVLSKMRIATAFLSCSIYGEPFAGTIIETLASGTPLIGSRDGSIEEVVRHEESALLFEREDAETLSRHMERIITDLHLRKRLTLAGADVIERRYTLDRILDQTEQALDQVIGKRPAPAGAA